MPKRLVRGDKDLRCLVDFLTSVNGALSDPTFLTLKECRGKPGMPRTL